MSNVTTASPQTKAHRPRKDLLRSLCLAAAVESYQHFTYLVTNHVVDAGSLNVALDFATTIHGISKQELGLDQGPAGDWIYAPAELFAIKEKLLRLIRQKGMAANKALKLHVSLVGEH